MVADALSRKERLKPRRVRAMSITIHSGLKTKILEAQGEASKDLKAPAEWLRGLEIHFERRDNGEITHLDRILVPSVGDVRKLIMDKAHTSRYSVHPGADKMYYDLRDLYWRHGVATSKSMADKGVKPLEFKLETECYKRYLHRREWYDLDLSLSMTLSCVEPQEVLVLRRNVQVAFEDEIEIDANLHFVEEPIEIVERDVKKLKRRRIPLVKVRWNSRANIGIRYAISRNVEDVDLRLYVEQSFSYDDELLFNNLCFNHVKLSSTWKYSINWRESEILDEEVFEKVFLGFVESLGHVEDITFGGQCSEERISKKRTKNEAKSTKPDTEWKSVEKTKSRQSQV
ncbi:hypothetical protein Tco_0591620 [Tanacetum coccineum]